MQIFKLTYILPFLLLALLTACSKDDVNDLDGNSNIATESTEVPVTFNLGITRGTLTPAVNNDELITSYMIVVAEKTSDDKAGKIVRVLKASSLTAAEMHSVKASLTATTSGTTYKVYAFANIPFASEGDYLYGKFTVGESMPDLSTMFYGVDNGHAGPIPMSSVNGLDLTILPTKGNLTYGIEVIRMLAKLEFSFTNSSADAIVLNKIGVGPLTKSGATSNTCIPLMTYNDGTALSFSSDAETEDFVYNLPSAITIPANTTATNAKSVSFYIVESTPNSLSKAFSLSFNVQQGSQPVENRYAMLDKSLVIVNGDINPSGTNLDGDSDKSPFIRRNDWIRIPVDFGSYEFKIEARSYPPIGGYPEANVTQSEDGFIAEFTTPGLFSIRPAIRQYGTTNWIYLSDSRISNPSIDIDTDPAHDFTDIFVDDKAPTLNKYGEILGTLNSSTHGTALVTLTVTIDGRTLTRKLYITQK